MIYSSKGRDAQTVVSADPPCEFSGWSEIQWAVNWNSRISSGKSHGTELGKESKQTLPLVQCSWSSHRTGNFWAPWGRGCHPDWELRILELVHASTLKSLAAFILELVRLRKWGCAGKFAKAPPGFPPPGKQGLALFKPLIPSRLTLRVWAKVWRSRHFSLKRELLVSFWKASVAFRGFQNDVLNPEKKQKKVKSLSRVQLFATPWIVA